MRVVGLDLSLTATGVAVYVDPTGASPIHYAGSVISKPAGDDVQARSSRIRKILTGIMDLADPAGAALVIIEGPAFGKNNSGTWDRAWLWGKVVDELMARGCPLAVAPPQQGKIYATGKGNATKAEVQIAVQKRWPQFGATDDNMSDAVAMVTLALHRIGRPLEPMPQTHTRALTGVAWPF